MRTALQHLKKDAVMAKIIAQAGPFRMQYGEPCFENLVRSIVSQQLNTKVATVIFARLFEAVGLPEITAAGIMRLRSEKMRRLGLSGGKTVYIRELAKHTKRGSVVFEDMPGMDDAAVIEHLTKVKGIGVWTAQMFLMFSLRRNDVLPVGDLAIRVAMKAAYGLEALPKPAEMEQIAAAWKPYQSVACWYLWRSLDGPGRPGK